MSVNNWVIVDASDKSVSQKSINEDAMSDHELDAPLSDLIEKQRRLSQIVTEPDAAPAAKPASPAAPEPAPAPWSPWRWFVLISTTGLLVFYLLF